MRSHFTHLPLPHVNFRRFVLEHLQPSSLSGWSPLATLWLGLAAAPPLLMNYKQTLRPPTFVLSGLQPGDKYLSTQKSRAPFHAVLLSPHSMFANLLDLHDTSPGASSGVAESEMLSHLTKESGFDRRLCLKKRIQKKKKKKPRNRWQEDTLLAAEQAKRYL